MTRVIWSLASILLVSYFLINIQQPIAVYSAGDPLQNQPLTSEISLGYSNWTGWWPWAIAESENLFQKHDLNVKLQWYDNYTKSLEDFAAGYLDANSQTLSDTITFEEQARDIKGQVVVLVNDNSAGNDKIIADREIQGIKDLPGKTVAVEAGVVDDFLLSLALDKEGISRKEINILDAETGAAVEAYVADQAQAVGAFPPFWKTALTKDGAHELVSSKDFPGAIPDLLVVSRDLVKNHKAEVQKLIAVWFDTLAWTEKHPEKAEQIMAERAGVNTSELEDLFAGTKMFDVDDNVEAFKRDKKITSLYGASKIIADFLNVNPNRSKMIDPQFINNYAKSPQNNG